MAGNHHFSFVAANKKSIHYLSNPSSSSHGDEQIIYYTFTPFFVGIADLGFLRFFLRSLSIQVVVLLDLFD